MEVSYSIQYFSSKEYIFDLFRNFSLQVLHLNKKINNKIFFIYKQVLLATSNIIYISPICLYYFSKLTIVNCNLL
jgi:hypothetical protein